MRVDTDAVKIAKIEKGAANIERILHEGRDSVLKKNKRPKTNLMDEQKR